MLRGIQWLPWAMFAESAPLRFDLTNMKPRWCNSWLVSSQQGTYI